MAVINTNIASINGQRNLSKSSMDLTTSIQRLSSGLRINSAKDDAAGLAITSRQTAQIRGLNQAIRNANDGVSVAQTAEGAVGEVGNILQRMRELAVQSANDSNSATDRASLQKEFSQLNAEVDRIASQTEFNGKKLLDGSFVSQLFQVGASANQTIGISIGNTKATNIGANQVVSKTNVGGALTAANDVSGGNNVVAQTLSVSGSLGTASIPNTTLTADSTAKGVADAVNAVTGQTGVTATARTTATVGSLSAAGTVSFTLYGQSSAAISANVTSTSDLSALSDAINAQTASTGITATLSANKSSLSLANESGYDIKIEDFANSTAAAQTISVAGTTLTEAGTDSLVVGGTVTFSSSSSFSVSSDDATNTILSGAQTANSSLTSLASQKIDNQANANTAISIIDGALNFTNDLRATLGAVQNRLGSAVANLEATSENVSAARSRIQDADFASETANLTRAQILQQAGTAMLAQANALPQNVLTLLRG